MAASRPKENHGAGEVRQTQETGWSPCELSGEKSKRNPQRACTLEVVLSSGRRIEVRRDFDADALGRVVKVMEGHRAQSIEGLFWDGSGFGSAPSFSG